MIKRIGRWLFSIRFLLLFLALFYLLNYILILWAPVENSPYFTKNDYEKIILSHDGQTAYDKVLYGSSTTVCGYLEAQSQSGYVNFGMAYATITDLKAMLEKGYLKVETDLVLNMNYLLFLDTLDTNPTYPWFRHPLEPYVYFQRDRIAKVLDSTLENLFAGEPLLPSAPEMNLTRTLVYGSLTEEELAERLEVHRTTLWNQPLENYRKNLEALAWVAQWCKDNDVRLRALWGPWNNSIPIPENPQKVMDAVEEVLKPYGIEVADMTGILDVSCFYDVGHLNQEIGAVRFTEVLDTWLAS